MPVSLLAVVLPFALFVLSVDNVIWHLPSFMRIRVLADTGHAYYRYGIGSNKTAAAVSKQCMQLNTIARLAHPTRRAVSE